jgi:hypothetical protein
MPGLGKTVHPIGPYPCKNGSIGGKSLKLIPEEIELAV